ncbi:BMP family ABC transporter substrate-binding protein [Corallococcus praedator]|uniref:BMP family ABC transporter substrate-binding protein n=1 Tax=Corallococcus praedator TaxID=2316724 RepID=A0ABX9QDI8_9BACT|nr:MULTISPECIES: BMP family ABC transporter substrate-binding protein [Corallococcus]RKH25258.1 BMP family ABC transporter substrate-binding protein [Corallococcus sp. CA031C]RKI02487.1 BMP family ABC transporter substrate-binding protein [Corallococcus praedator]
MSPSRHILCLALCLLAASPGCKKEQPSTTPPVTEARPSGDTSTVGLVLGLGGRGDHAFNDSALRGLELWAAGVKYEKAGYEAASTPERLSSLGADLGARAPELAPLGITPVVLQSRVAEDYEPNLQLLADQQVSLAMGVGFMLENAVEQVARRNPKLPFLLVDSPLLDAQGRALTLPNVRTVIFREEEGCFLAGALAGLVTKTGQVGMVGGMKIPLVQRYEAGFRAGVAATNPKATVLVNYTGSFTDFALGKQVGQDLLLKNTDVLFAAAGVDGLGAIQAVKEARDAGQPVYVIGVDSDPSHLAPRAVLSAVIKRVDLVVYEAIRDQRQGRLQGGNLSLGLKEGGIALSPVRLDFPGKEEALRTLDALRARIISGELKVPLP